MTFFLLALAHAMDIQEMVERDTEDALEREALEEISSMHLNTKKMDIAHHNATGLIYFNKKTYHIKIINNNINLQKKFIQCTVDWSYQ